MLFQIKFLSCEGVEEPGIGHGVFKEFVTLLNKQAYDIHYGYFIETEEKTLFPNPQSAQIDSHIQ